MKNILLVLLVLGFSSCEREETPKPQPSITQGETKSASVLISEAKEKLEEAKQKLMQEGKYGCCVKHACDYCALHEGSCDCYDDVKKGEHVCIECYAGWQRGEGGVENVKKEQVKVDYFGHKH